MEHDQQHFLKQDDFDHFTTKNRKLLASCYNISLYQCDQSSICSTVQNPAVQEDEVDEDNVSTTPMDCWSKSMHTHTHVQNHILVALPNVRQQLLTNQLVC